ncbi:MAG: hypothetical protein COB14_07090 [Alphaproteobacteria bacterium]|nr:MAG: hypothetical protein COB14_07090 [Alphaproteobacteria bacterium]
MKILFLFLVVFIFPVESFADIFTGKKAGFYSYCTITEKKTDAFCKCAEDHGLGSVMNRPSLFLQRRVGADKNNLKHLGKRLLLDPAMTMERINKICDVADKYSTVLNEFSAMDDAKITQKKLTAEQKNMAQKKRKEITETLVALHEQYGSKQQTVILLKSRSSGYCAQRSDLVKREQEYELAKQQLMAEDTEINYNHVINTVSLVGGQCRALYAPR